MKKILFATLPLLLLTAFSSSGCKKGFIDRYGPFYISSDTTIFYEGTSTGRVENQFERLIADYPNIVSITFSSFCPGSINDESLYSAANKVRSLGIKTILTSESVVESGAVDLFISGAEREIADGAQIGVHSWSAGSQDGADLPQGDEEHNMYLDFYNIMFDDNALGEEFYWFTLNSASSDDIHYMTTDEIEHFNLVTE
jgi:hypothetical protein